MPEDKNELKAVHDGITITYDERDDVWRFILRGRNRKADSLKQAKDFIDKPIPEEVKKKIFEPTQAYFKGRYGDDKFEEVTVTSIAEDSKYSSIEVWIKNAKGERSKESLRDMFLKNDANTKVIAQLKALDKQKEALEAQRDRTFDTLQRFEVEKEPVTA